MTWGLIDVIVLPTLMYTCQRLGIGCDSLAVVWLDRTTWVNLGISHNNSGATSLSVPVYLYYQIADFTAEGKYPVIIIVMLSI